MENWKRRKNTAYGICFLLPLAFYFLVFRREESYPLSNSLAASGLCYLAAGCLWKAKKSGLFSAAAYGFRKFKALLAGGRDKGEPYHWEEGRHFRWQEEGVLLAAGALFLLFSVFTI